MERGCGILLHVSSLPGKWGIGCFSKPAFEFIDFLKSAGIKYWQVLAFGPTGYGNSPYAPLSVFAGNPYFIDLSLFFTEQELLKYGLHSKTDKKVCDVDFGNLFTNKFRALKDLFKRGYDKAKLQTFIKENKYWVEPYAIYMAIKEVNGFTDWRSWKKELCDPKSLAVAAFADEHRDEINFHIFCQMIFFDQWSKLKNYANEKGIQIIGDVPIYPAMDSADVWTYRNQFDFEDDAPAGVAGVPPDYFNKDGQLWGNPLYNYKQMARDKYKWWLTRLGHTRKMFDILRLDHFRAFDTYYKIPPKAKDAREGVWCKGPGIKFFNALKNAEPQIKLILEDLGDLSQTVLTLRDATGYPGMRVMQFGFDGNTKNEHLPANYPQNCVGYIGTHDNDTFIGLLQSVTKEQRKYIDEYLFSSGLGYKDTARLAFENILTSKADIVVLCLQDLLFQGNTARMNLPGSTTGNWKYRINSLDLSSELCAYLRMLIERGQRA